MRAVGLRMLHKKLKQHSSLLRSETTENQEKPKNHKYKAYTDKYNNKSKTCRNVHKNNYCPVPALLQNER